MLTRGIVLSLLLTLAACSPASGWKKTANLVNDGGVIVQRERMEGYRAEHPAKVDGKVLAEELCALSFFDRFVVGAPQEPTPAWPCEAAQAVAMGIAEGLADAGPDERVRFWVRWQDGDQTIAWYVPHERHTRGVAFWREGGLELVFDRVALLEGETPHAGKDPTQQASRRVRLIPPPRATLVVAEGKRRPMQLRWETFGEPPAAVDLDGLSPEQRARLEFLDDLHEAGEIDTPAYERRRRELLDSVKK